MKQIILFLLTTALLVSCSINSSPYSTQDPPASNSVLKLTTRVFSPFPVSSDETFEEGAEMGLFITSSNPDTSGKSEVRFKNVLARAIPKDRSRPEWICTPCVTLSSEPVLLYAYSPYQPHLSVHPTAIPIRLSADARRTPNYLYGTLAKGHKRICSGSPVALVSMKPALATLSVEVYADKKLTEFPSLHKIQISNQPGGTAFCQQGLLNLLTGEIRPIPTGTGATALKMSTPTRLDTLFAQRHELKVLPMHRPIKQGEIEILFSLNNQTYRYPLPANTCWEKGCRYAYRFVFTGDRIRLEQMNKQAL